MKCSICGKEITHPLIKDYMGNNPWPVRAGEDDRCCDECNSLFVTPARICTMSLPDDNRETFFTAIQKDSYKDLIKLFIG